MDIAEIWEGWSLGVLPVMYRWFLRPCTIVTLHREPHIFISVKHNNCRKIALTGSLSESRDIFETMFATTQSTTNSVYAESKARIKRFWVRFLTCLALRRTSKGSSSFATAYGGGCSSYRIGCSSTSASKLGVSATDGRDVGELSVCASG